MRLLFTALLLLSLAFSVYSQEQSFQEEFDKLEQELKNSDRLGQSISTCSKIIEISFPGHLQYVSQYCQELLKLSDSANDMNSKAFAYFYLGEFYYQNDDFGNAGKNYNEALTIYQNLENISQVAQINHNLGLVNQYLNQYDKALEHYQKSIELNESLENFEKVALSYQNIGTLYYDIEKYTLAQDYYNKALDIYIKNNNKDKIAAIYQNIGVLYYSRGDFGESLEYYKKSLGIYETINDKQNIGISLSNIGLVYEENKRYDLALEYYQKALIVFEDIGYKPTLVYIFYNLGSIYKNIEDYEKSIKYYNKGLGLSAELSMKDYISYNYEALSALYEENHNYKKALDYYKDFMQVKDSILNDEKYLQIQELEAKFQAAQQEKKIEILKKDKELKELQLKKKEAQNLILIISSILTIFIAFILWWFYSSQRKAGNRLLNEIEERKKTEEQLNQVKGELELRVKSRTSELEEANELLIKEVEEHKKTTESLRVAKDKAEESDKLKSIFLANMSHEVRTPMNAISGFSQMLAFDDIAPDKRKHYVDMVLDGCKSLTNLIDDIVDFAEIDSGDVKIEIKEFNPHPMLDFLSDYFTGELLKREKENLKLIYLNENTENDIVIKTDPSRLKQILSILLDNAVKFTEEGSIEFGFTHPNEKELYFFVKDTGIGIDEKYEEVIFEKFRQIDDSISKKYGGAGIGLSVAKNLVEILEGKIWFESSPGRGSTFYFSIPFNSEYEFVKEKKQEELNWEDKVILVAEDKKINFEIIQETLSIANVTLIWAKNGEEALKHVESDAKIDLILMDIQMPGMDGYECTKRIKEITSQIPIIAQTAYALPQDSYKCFDAGCDDYIAKPISLAKFIEKIAKYLS